MGAASLQPLRIGLDAFRRLVRDSRAGWARMAIVILISLGLTGVLSATPFFGNIQLLIDDWSHNLVASKQPFDNVVLIDADQKSIDILAEDYGQWPYSRSALAKIIRYVNRAGAAAVVLEPSLELPAVGDDELSEALREFGGAVIGVRGLNANLPRPLSYQRALERFDWPVASTFPSRPWVELGLPASEFVMPGVAAGVGVVNLALEKRDAYARYFHLMHLGRDVHLPSLPLAALAVKANLGPEMLRYSAGRDTVSFGSNHWPVDGSGRVWPLTPPNINNMPTMSVWQILLSAVNDPGGNFFNDELKDKVVFIGSTAPGQASVFSTPQGLVAGLPILANFYDALSQGRLLAPPRFKYDAILVAVALLLPLLALRNRLSSTVIILTVGSLAAIVIIVVFLLLLLGNQLSSLLFAYLTLAIGLIVQLVFRAKYHVDAGQALFYEKLAAEGANQLKSEFLAQMTHELRTPLTAVIGFNRLLSDGSFDGAERTGERENYRRIIDNNCQHLLQLINNILDHSKLIAGQMLIEPAVVNVPTMLTNTAKGLMPLAEEKDLEIQLSLDEHIPDRLLVDEFRLRQVLLNIMGNALKFTRAGYVKLNAEWDNGWLEISVEDTGCGIPEPVLARVFDSFQQADVTVAKQYGGTGLGLSISRDLVQLMGGRLKAESEVDVGSVFTVRLPASYSRRPERHLQEVPLVEAEPVDLKRISGARVLLADDSPDIRALVKLYLKSVDVAVDAVENGKIAVAEALKQRPDLVLMDMEMPIMDGYEAIALLRSRGFKAPIVGFTAHSSDDIQQTISELGADAIVRKPVTKEHLLDSVGRVLIDYRATLDGGEAAHFPSHAPDIEGL